jgi:hypothetical protein
MKPLVNIKKAPLETAQILANNKTLVKLLTISTPDVLKATEENIYNLNELIQNQYINFYAPTEYGIKNFDRAAQISIFVDQITPRPTDSNMYSHLVVYFGTKTDNILLEDNKNRLLEAIDCIIQSLDGQKISASGQLECNSCSYMFFDDFHAGYRVSFTFTDQQNRKVDF